MVPTERTVKIKGGRRVEEEEKVYPGYVLVDMIVDDQSWFVVRNTPRVTGFVGSGVNPVPLKQHEVDELLGRMQAADPEPGRRKAIRSAQPTFAALDAACAHLRDADGIDAIILSAQGSSALTAALWCDARPISRPVGPRRSASSRA